MINESNITNNSDSEAFDGDISICTPSRRPCHRPIIKRAKPRVTMVTNDENDGVTTARNSIQEPFTKPKGLRSTDSLDNITRNVSSLTGPSVQKGKTDVEVKKSKPAKGGVRFQILDEISASQPNGYGGIDHLRTPKRDSPGEQARKDKAGRTPFAVDVLNTSDDVLDNVFGPQRSPYNDYGTSITELLGHNYGLDDAIMDDKQIPCNPSTPENISVANGSKGKVASLIKSASVTPASLPLNARLKGDESMTYELDLEGANNNDESLFASRIVEDLDASFDIMGLLQSGRLQLDASTLAGLGIDISTDEPFRQLTDVDVSACAEPFPSQAQTQTPVNVATQSLQSTPDHFGDVPTRRLETAYVPQSAKSVMRSPTALEIRETPVFSLPEIEQSDVYDSKSACESDDLAQAQAQPTGHGKLETTGDMKSPKSKLVASVAAAVLQENVDTDGVSLSRPRVVGRNIRVQGPMASVRTTPSPKTQVPLNKSRIPTPAAEKSSSNHSLAAVPTVGASPCLNIESLKNFRGDSPVPRPSRLHSFSAVDIHASATDFLVNQRKDLSLLPNIPQQKLGQPWILHGTAGRVPIIFGENSDNDDLEDSYESLSVSDDLIYDDHDNAGLSTTEASLTFQRSIRNSTMDSTSFPHSASYNHRSMLVNMTEMQSILIDASTCSEDDVPMGLSQLLPAEFVLQTEEKRATTSPSLSASGARVTPLTKFGSSTGDNKLGSASRVPLGRSADNDSILSDTDEIYTDDELENHSDDDDISATRPELIGNESLDSNKATALEMDYLEDGDDDNVADDDTCNANDSSVFSAATTITLDMTQHSPSAGAPRKQASLAMARKHRRKDFNDCDVKEILLLAQPGTQTSTVILFNNRGKSALNLSANAVHVRFDALSSDEYGGELSSSSENLTRAQSAFSVQPVHQVVEQGEDAVFTISFTPSSRCAGNYMGVLRIRSHGKVKERTLCNMIVYPCRRDADTYVITAW
jgi:hypothetical protein